MGEERPIQDALKPRVQGLFRSPLSAELPTISDTVACNLVVRLAIAQEGWLDVKQGDTWTKHWCLVTEMRQIKEKLEGQTGQATAGSYVLPA
jgi:hypothetical protein